MKSTNFRFFLIAFFLMIPAAVYPQGSESTQPGPVTQSRETLVDDSNLVVTRSVSGAIVSLKDGILTLRTAKNKEVRIALLTATRYKLGKKKIDPRELEEAMFSNGRPVKVTYKPFAHRLVDKVAVEVRFEEVKNTEKPVLTSS